jgi:dienelactone hydrolase
VDATQVVGLGFGFGGLCALDLARSGVDIKGAISIYGHFDSPKSSNRDI